MSKTIEQVLLVPGESGWEIWTGPGDGVFTLKGATETAQAGELGDIPSGDLTMLFAVKSVTALPIRVSSDDDALFPDLVMLHAERLGLRPDPMAGQLSDVFVIAREAENTALLSVFLRSPGEGDLPPRGPKGFDVSARAFPVAGNTLAVWKEFGRWVFALFHEGKLVFCQATAVDAAQPVEALAREIRLSLIQLAMQGMDVEPSKVLVWTSRENVDTSALSTAFRVAVEVSPRPAPVLPSPLSKLLPADVRAARRAAQRRRNITLGVAAAVAVYLGLLGWFGFGIWKIHSQTKKTIAEAEEIAPDEGDFRMYETKWAELSQAIDLKNNPVDILKRIADCIPPNSGLRLKIADISSTEIKLTGEAPTLQAANTFSLKLSKHNELANFTWDAPPANQASATGRWEFVFTAEVPTEQQP